MEAICSPACLATLSAKRLAQKEHAVLREYDLPINRELGCKTIAKVTFGAAM